MILRSWSIRERESFAVASLTFWVVGHLNKAILVKLPHTHTHTHNPLLTKRPSPCYDLWKVLGSLYIFHKGILLHPHGLWGTAHCGLVPKQRRIKCRTWHWNRNLTAVSSGNLDLDLNSNKVFFFFHSISQIQARTLHSVFPRSYFIEYHFR